VAFKVILATATFLSRVTRLQHSIAIQRAVMTLHFCPSVRLSHAAMVLKRLN